MQQLVRTIAVLALCVVAASAPAQTAGTDASRGAPARSIAHPVEGVLKRAGSTSIDLRKLPHAKPRRRERPEREPPDVVPVELPHDALPPQPAAPLIEEPTAAAPSPLHSYAGLDHDTWGAGYPPDTNADVGPGYIIETVNTSIGIFDKSNGALVTAFAFDTLMSQGAFGNLCDTDNFGDPVVLYDTFEDRWIISDFAFKLDGSSNVVYPPGAFQCFAVSKSGDPVNGGWYFYSINTTGGLGDYPKLGVWPDGIYLSVNMYDYAFAGSFQNPRLYAFNKAQMYAGAASVQVVSFDAPKTEFTLLPANARVQTGTPPPGSPNYFAVVWNYNNALSVYKFHVDWNSISTSTLTGPFNSFSSGSWSQFTGGGAATPQNTVDTLYPRLMAQNQYSSIGGIESLWNSHTVGKSGTSSATSSVRYYQVKVTGGNVLASTSQAFTLNTDNAFRYMPSVEVDRAGNMAMAYSASSGSLDPAIRYSGRLANDGLNTLLQTENSLIEGGGSQNNSTRWGDYSSMSLDPDGCTFWFANEYYAVDGGNWQTRIGAFRYPGCTSPATGSLQGRVTASAGGGPIWNAMVALGTRTTTTDGNGNYAFAGLAPGTYPNITVTDAGYTAASVSSVAIAAGAATTQDFALTLAATGTCRTDTTQADFQTGVPTNVDLTTTPDSAMLAHSLGADQHADANSSSSGYPFDTTNLLGQTFTPAVTGKLSEVDAFIFCGIVCNGSNPNMILELRTTSGVLPNMSAGGLLATSTTGSSSSTVAGYFSFPFATLPMLTSGTQYALVMRLAANRQVGNQTWVVSSGDVYAGGRRFVCNTSACSLPTGTNSNSDLIFQTVMQDGFFAAGDFISSPLDANPIAGSTAAWTTLSWNATAPASTQLQFQVAASNNAYGPYTYVGPDGTAGTYYTGGSGSLAQFSGKRYARYRAYFTTSDDTVTPTLADVTTCYANSAGGPTADLSITISDSVASAAAGTQVIYAIRAANAGPAAAIGASVADAFPATLTCDWTCAGANTGTCTASGAGDINDSAVNLPGGASVTYTATCTIASAATGTVINTATISTPGPVSDLAVGNNSATDTDTLTASADLAITNSDGVTTAAPGGSVTYTIEATNNGPSDAPASTVADAFPAALTCNWTCGGAGGGSCTAAGSGSINDIHANLPSGGSVTYAAVCNIAPTASGSLANTASVTVPAGVTETTPGNNSATDADTLALQADLAVTLTDHHGFVQVGDVLDYVIDVTNPTGPSPVVANVSDTLPPELLGGAWVCTASGSASCGNGNGSGNTLTDTATLPVGGKASYSYSATVLGENIDGAVVNTASATLNAGSDPTPGNDSATDTDAVVIFRDGFDGAAALVAAIDANGTGYVAARLQLDAGLVAHLGIVPVEIASGRARDGERLFALHLARFGATVALRVVTSDARGNREVSPWQSLALERRLLQFAWQSATDGAADGSFAAGDAGAMLRLERRGTLAPPIRLVIPVDAGVPRVSAVEQ